MADDLQSQMKFIVEQQAQFAADIGALKEMIEAHSRQLESLTSNVRQLIEVNMSLTHHLEETDRRLGARIEQLAEAQAHSDRRLDALIDTVDKLVRRNGGTLCPSNGGCGFVRDWSSAMGTPLSPEPVGTPAVHADPFDASNPDQLDADVIASVALVGKLHERLGGGGEVGVF